MRAYRQFLTNHSGEMPMVKSVLLGAISFILALGVLIFLPPYPANADAHQTITCYNSGTAVATANSFSNTTTRNAQTFSPDSSGIWEITHVTLRIRRTNDSDSGTTFVEIREGGPTGTLLGSSSKSTSSLSTSSPAPSIANCDPVTTTSANTWAFSPAVEITSGNSYAIVIRKSTGAATIQWFAVTTDGDYLQGSRYHSTNSGSSYTEHPNDDHHFKITGLFVGSISTPTPTPTPQPTPTPTPHPQTPHIIAEHFAPNTENCLVTHDAGDTRIFLQPFTPAITAQIESVRLLIRKSGIPRTLAVSVWNIDDTGTPTLEDAVSMATGFFDLDTISHNQLRNVTVNLSPNATVFAGTRYGLVVAVVEPSPEADNICWVSEFDFAYGAGTSSEAYESDSFLTWTALAEASTVTFDFTVNAYTSASGYVPSNPAAPEPKPAPGASYSAYSFSWTNAYINMPLFYGFSTMTSDTTFIVRRINEQGNPIANVAAYTVVAGSSVGFTHQTNLMSAGPFEIYDVTNNKRLMRHYLLPEPSSAFKANSLHRSAANFAVGHGEIVYRTGGSILAIGGVNHAITHLHNPLNPLQSMLQFLGYTALHYRLPTAENPNNVFLSIRNANTLEEHVRVSIADLADYNGINESVAFGDAVYFQNYVILNTSGNNLPFVQNFNMLDVVGATLESGIYNYALVTSADVVLSEGESVIIVANEMVTPWSITAERPRYALGSAPKFRLQQHNPSLFPVYNDFRFTGCCGLIPDFVSNQYAFTQTLTYTNPLQWPAPLPATINTTLNIRPAAMPYTSTPIAYSFHFIAPYQLTEQMGIIGWVEDGVATLGYGTSTDKIIFGILLMMMLAFSAVRLNPFIVIMLEALLFAFLGIIGWFPAELLLMASVFVGMIILVLYLLRSRGAEN